MKIGDNKVAYCDCGRRIGPTDQIGDTTECDVCNEKTEWGKDKAFLRSLREQHEEKLEYDNKLSKFRAAYPDKIPQVGSGNYIQGTLMEPPGKPPYIQMIMIVEGQGKFIEYNFDQYEGLMCLLTDLQQSFRNEMAIYRARLDASV
jgi:hypothetical protein